MYDVVTEADSGVAVYMFGDAGEQSEWNAGVAEPVIITAVEYDCSYVDAGVVSGAGKVSYLSDY